METLACSCCSPKRQIAVRHFSAARRPKRCMGQVPRDFRGSNYAHSRESKATKSVDGFDPEQTTDNLRHLRLAQKIPHGRMCLSDALSNRRLSYGVCSFALCPLSYSHFQHPLLPLNDSSPTFRAYPLLYLDSFPTCSLTQERFHSRNDRGRI